MTPRTQRRTAARRRAGFTLVEGLGTFAVSGLVLSSLVIVMYGLFETQRETQRALQQSLAVPKLSVQWRTDVHLAREAGWDESEGRLRLTQPGSRVVVYQRKGDRLIRRALVDDRQEHLEVFALPPSSELAFAIDDDAGRLRLTLTSREGNIESAADARRQIVLDAALQLHRPQVPAAESAETNAATRAESEPES